MTHEITTLRLHAARTGARRFACVALAFLAGCGSSGSAGGGSGVDATPDTATADTGAGSVGDASDAPQSDADASDTTPDAPASAPLTVTFDPITVQPGVEDTQCVVKSLGNSGPIHIGSIHDVLTGGGTLLVYAVPDTVEQPTPTPCQPFSGFGTPNANAMALSRAPDDLLAFPAGVGVTLAAHQLVRLELHFSNPTGSPIQVGATSTMTPMADPTFQSEAGLLLLVDPDVNLPPNATTTLGPVYFPLPSSLAGAQVFAASGVENRFGTGVRTGVTASKAGSDTPMYAPASFAWDAPTTSALSPPLAVPAGGGFHATCTWNNTSSMNVTNGWSYTSELCLGVVHYAPGSPSRMCVHTEKLAGGLDLCCPGDPLCSMLFP